MSGGWGLVGLEDLFPTLLTAMGAERPAHRLHGSDVTPLLTGNDRPPAWRDAYYIENVTFGGLEGLNVLPGRRKGWLNETLIANPRNAGTVRGWA